MQTKTKQQQRMQLQGAPNVFNYQKRNFHEPPTKTNANKKMCINLKTGLCCRQNVQLATMENRLGMLAENVALCSLWYWLVRQSWPAVRFSRQVHKANCGPAERKKKLLQLVLNVTFCYYTKSYRVHK